ncbi:histone acetyltransferase [Coemansia aciculifera]|nr:histone acetyltransferase [Coemansia aciculifera]
MSTYGEKYESRLNATRDAIPRQGSDSNNNITNGGLAINRKRVHSDDGDEGDVKDEFDDYDKEEDDDTASKVAEEAVGNGEEKTAMVEEQQGLIRFEVVYNNSEDESMRRLTELKNIFQKQLPKMPKEYIARLVYDRNHSSLAIVKSNGHVVGGITFRLFEQRQFAEIVFCAVSSSEQVKGFTKDITLDKRLWMGYIKDYEGGTLMQNPGLTSIDPFSIPGIEPMDLMTLESNVDENKYLTLEAFIDDTRKIFLNCKNYNGEGTRYWRCATSLEKFFDDKVREWKARTTS